MLCRLELLSAGESADDDSIEAGVAYQLGDEFQRLLTVAGKRNAHAVAVAVRLPLERLGIHRVEALHPLSTENIVAAQPADPDGCPVASLAA